MLVNSLVLVCACVWCVLGFLPPQKFLQSFMVICERDCCFRAAFYTLETSCLRDKLWKWFKWFMACNGVLPPSKNFPQIGNPPVLKCFNSPPSSKFLLPSPTGNKKHEDVKLMHKSLVQHTSWQKKTKWNLKKYSKPNASLNI